MAVLEVHDPPMCCSTGVCGPDVDPKLAQLTLPARTIATSSVMPFRVRRAAS